MTHPQVPIIDAKKLHQVGSSLMISLPLDWFRNHGYGESPVEIKKNLPDLLIVADRDIRIVNPHDRKQVYREVSKMVGHTKRFEKTEERE